MESRRSGTQSQTFGAVRDPRSRGKSTQRRGAAGLPALWFARGGAVPSDDGRGGGDDRARSPALRLHAQGLPGHHGAVHRVQQSDPDHGLHVSADRLRFGADRVDDLLPVAAAADSLGDGARGPAGAEASGVSSHSNLGNGRSLRFPGAVLESGAGIPHASGYGSLSRGDRLSKGAVLPES